MSLKIPWLERNHRDADRINRSCLGGRTFSMNVSVRLSLQISLSYAIFIIMISVSLLLSISAAFAVDIHMYAPSGAKSVRRYICN